ncbi:MAG: hypothetical protein IJU19_08025 [Bacteroidales bacterium]|nr:hypothetical protein [Bacteroidales bacterium]
MAKFKQYVLPVAIVLGLLFHDFCRLLSPLVPVLIFTILLLTFSAVDLRKLRLTRFDYELMLWQVVGAIVAYFAIRFCGGSKIVAEGLMMGFLCPVAASSTVVSCMLGANRERVTTFTIASNLMVAIVAPILLTLLGDHPERSLGTAYLLTFGKIVATLALPFLIVFLMQLCFPKVNATIARRTGWSYYVWAIALFLTLGQTIHYIFTQGAGHWHLIAWLAVLSLAVCIVQFYVGRRLGRRHADPVAGAQMMAQKNSAMGIWMANTFLTPLSSVFMATYSVYQNLYNAHQISKAQRK